MSKSNLVGRDQEVLDAIGEHVDKHGSMPTFAELGDALGISRQRCHMIVKRLREKGMLNKRLCDQIVKRNKRMRGMAAAAK